MKITYLFTGLLMLLSSQAAFSSMTISSFETKSKTQAVDNYVQGLASGLNAANKALVAKESTPFFCLPPFLNLKTANYKEIISLGIKDAPTDKLERQSLDIDPILLKKLIELYPCGYN